MPHTRSWNEATPAGSDLASSIDNSMRETKVDVRERMALEHLINSGTTTPNTDGMHLDPPVTKSAGYTLTPEDRVVVFTAAATLSLYAVATRNYRMHHIINDSSGTVVIDPNGVETIGGLATVDIPAGGWVTIWNNGTKWFVR